MGNGKAFDFPKPPALIQYFIQMITNKNDIILDSFAGSGTTAHAVLNLNKADGGQRKFILVEMMDYADSITAERVKRVIQGYGEGKTATPSTGGNFSFYDLGEVLLKSDGNLNENVGTNRIREYVWYTETQEAMQPICEPDNAYYLGLNRNTTYYFYYERDAVTTLDYAFLATVKKQAGGYIIYADLCALSNAELQKWNITFKKIPRDIAKI
jgi:adenine-specific DNA-methyltransferase